MGMNRHLFLAPVLFVGGMLATPARAQSFQAVYDLTKVPGSAPDAPNVVAYGAVARDRLGSVRAGDLNGDGVDDLIVAAGSADVGAPLRTNAGAVYVWFGKGSLACERRSEYRIKWAV